MSIIEKVDLILSRIENKITRNTKRSVLYKFIKYIGDKDTYDSFDAIKFFNAVQNDYTGTSMNLVQQNIKWLYKRLGFEYGDIPNSKNRCINNVPCKYDDMVSVISNIGMFTPYMQFVIAMSTVYGLRRIEICSILSEDINMENNTIYIKTAKAGVDGGRWMYIPIEIRSIIKNNLDNCKNRSALYISSTFWYIMDKCSINIDSNRGGWHMIRRRLIIELTKVGLTDIEIIKFMRWKTKDNISSMLYRYSSTEPNEEVIENIDKKVFELHPFLKYFKVGITK